MVRTLLFVGLIGLLVGAAPVQVDLSAGPVAQVDLGAPAAHAASDDGFYVVWVTRDSYNRPEDVTAVLGPAAIIGPWRGGSSGRYAYLESPSVASIRAAVAVARAEWAAERRDGLRAIPKAEATARLDGDDKAAGPWPVDGLLFPQGMRPYERAKRTQEIAVTNDVDRITPVSIASIDHKWGQSGGMQDVVGFRSDVYRNEEAERVKRWVGDIRVKNSLGGYQSNRGWKREYPDGAKFMDVLSFAGRVFEVRQREKVGGRWHASVIYEDVRARPLSYVGLNVSCASCHDQAGTGDYAAGLVPGGDTVLSDPFPALER